MMTELKSAKRGKNERAGIHSWHPYYAGYSEQFVRSAIDYLCLGNDDLILDPWNGSGTTTFVAEKNCFSSIGVEINPAMVIFASAKSGTVITSFEEIKNFLSYLPYVNTNKINFDFENDPLKDVLSERTVSFIRCIIYSIHEYSFTGYPVSKKISSSLKIQNSPTNPIKAFLQSSLFVTVRSLIANIKCSNPTWIKKIIDKPDIGFKELVKKFINNCEMMMNDLEFSGLQASESIMASVIKGDVRKLPLKTNSVSAVITSPPYLTRIDYAASTTIEIQILNEIAFREVRESTMGAPVILSDNIEPNAKWGITCNEILNKIGSHSSKASLSYYYKNFKQYFRDAQTSLEEIHRVLKRGKSSLIVVQSSYYKDIEFPLGEIYAEMGTELGFESKIAFREIVRGHMAHVNTRSSLYKKDKVYFEDVVQLIKK